VLLVRNEMDAVGVDMLVDVHGERGSATPEAKCMVLGRSGE
jgi:hypothetical protein